MYIIHKSLEPRYFEPKKTNVRGIALRLEPFWGIQSPRLLLSRLHFMLSVRRKCHSIVEVQ